MHAFVFMLGDPTLRVHNTAVQFSVVLQQLTYHLFSP